MAEEEKREFSETIDNEVPQGADYDVFECNVKTFLESHEMNRDYLNQIYKEDMSFLNKDVRMTRTEYLKEVDKINESYDKEEKFFRRLLVASIIIAIIAIVIAVVLVAFWYVDMRVYHQLYGGAVFGENSLNGAQLRGFWAMGANFGAIGWIILVCGIGQLLFFGSGYIKKLKSLKKNRQKALELLEERKKDFMLLGQYDAAK